MSVKVDLSKIYKLDQDGNKVYVPFFASGETDIDDPEEINRRLTELEDEKMQRYILKLVKNGDDYQLFDLENQSVGFEQLYQAIRETSNYVVCTYGSSKLRPQYVSTNEMLFIGLDRAGTNSKVLRMHVLPTDEVRYEAFELAEKSYVDDELGAIKGDIALYLTRVRDALANGDTPSAIAILDEAILDFSVLG